MHNPTYCCRQVAIVSCKPSALHRVLSGKEEVEEDVLGCGAETGSALTRGGDDAAAGRGDGRAALDGEADGGAGQGGHGGDAGEEMEGGADWA